ncbi:corrinoid protein [bacterium]|nr:corrinoid protein [bacterium]
MNILQKLSEAIQQGDDRLAASATQKAIEQQLQAAEILNNGLIAGMDIIGQRFRDMEIFLPDVLMAARAMHAGMDVLKPLLLQAGVESRGKIILGTVKGDLHDIGKNLVAIMLKGAGFEIFDLGVDVEAGRFIDAAVKEKASIIGLSALLTTTMPAMKEIIDLLKERGLSDQIKIIVGGAPLSQESANTMGANSYAKDAASAVETIKAMMV